MKNFGFLLVLLLLQIPLSAQTGKKGINYFNQSPPGMASTVFAPGIVSTDEEVEFGSFFSSNGKEFFFGVDVNDKAETRVMKFENNVWSKPEKLLVHDVYSYNDPFLSPDEKRLYFISDMPLSGSGPKKDFDIWYVEREGNKWSKPVNAGPNINSIKNEYYVCFTANGTIYFSSARAAVDTNNYDIYMARQDNGKFAPAVRVGDAINSPSYEGDVYVEKNETYMIFTSDRSGGAGRGDLYISFKTADGKWGTSKNMGKAVNEEKSEYCPVVSPDGKYLFFTAKGQIRWIDAKVIDQFR